jgi:formate hydrogenlyase transcriptional activator
MVTRPRGEKQDYDSIVEGMLEQLNMGLGFSDLFESIYDKLFGIIPYNRIAVALLEEPDHLLRLTSCRSDGEIALKVGYAAHIQGSTLERLLETAQPRIINDLDAYLAHKPTSASTQLIVREGMRSSLTLPLVADGQPIGVIFFSSREPNSYTEQHGLLLKRLAGHIAISIERTRLMAELQQRNEELARANQTKAQFLASLEEEVAKQTEQIRKSEQRYRRLVELGRVINSSLDLRHVFQVAAEEIRELIRCQRVSLLLTEQDQTTRQGFALEYEGEKRWLDLPPLPLSGSAAEWVMQHRTPRVARSLRSGRQFPEDQRLFAHGYLSYVYLPLVSQDKSLGVLGVASRETDAPDGWDFELLQGLCQQLAIALGNADSYGEIERLRAELERENVYLRDEIKTSHDFGNIIGDSQAMQMVRDAIQQVAETDSTVLVLGETGTGKELIARAVHDLSPRRDKLLVKVNCAALAPNLITSELFGHEAGAFTGATERRTGRFELAHEGSIFLDEISEVPQETQVMLLRVLQERTIERVGGSQSIPVDTRVIAATNRDLKSHTDKGHFRDDLYYRLHVFPIRVPPLRERREDIPALINHFIGRFARQMNKQITRVNRTTLQNMVTYDWPGNVRELENLVERAMIVSPGDTLEVDENWLVGSGKVPSDAVTSGELVRTLADIERDAILSTLAASRGKVYGPNGAASRLGLKPTTLYGKMRKHGIRRRDDQFDAEGE